MNTNEGIFKGEICNRNGCIGRIEESEKEGSCSCHVNPPCSYCTTDTAYCPTCDWSAEEERIEVESNKPKFKYEPYKAKTISDLDRTKIDWISYSHTHFSMIKEGVFPVGTNLSTILSKIRGTFGGRFEYFNKETGDFKYIAYTD